MNRNKLCFSFASSVASLLLDLNEITEITGLNSKYNKKKMIG